MTTPVLQSTPVLRSMTVDSPVGELLVVASSDGVLRVAFLDSESGDDVLDALSTTVSPRIQEGGAREVRRAFVDYFRGRSLDVDVPVDLRLARGFRHEALEALRQVPAGSTVAYRELAAMAGRPLAVRAAASACATNPVPVVVPCHRVVRSDGTLGGYGPGQAAKRTLLALEGVSVPD